jgi:hypothetical protein
MANLYRVTYVRKTRKESKVKTNLYSEGHFRDVTMVADSEDEALAIAERTHERQFSEEPAVVVAEEGSVAVVVGQATPVDPINAHSNYKLQGIEVLRRNV